MVVDTFHIYINVMVMALKHTLMVLGLVVF